MGIGASIFLIAVGAILTFAVHATVSGLDIATVGVILMAVGGLGLLWSIVVVAGARRSTYPEATVVERPTTTTYVRDERIYLAT